MMYLSTVRYQLMSYLSISVSDIWYYDMTGSCYMLLEDTDILLLTTIHIYLLCATHSCISMIVLILLLAVVST